MSGAVQSFTRKFVDESTEQGFEFAFYCDIGGEECETKFVPSGAGSKAGVSRLFGKGLALATSVLPSTSKTGEKGEAFMDEISERFGKMSPEWHKQHDAAFESAELEAKEHFRQCPVCKSWACPHCWNDQKSMCINDSKQTTICPQCHQPAGSGKFCNNCGAPLTIKCPKCGQESPVGTPFCGQCGTKFA